MPQLPGYLNLFRIVRVLRGDELRAMIDAATDVAKGSPDPRLQIAAQDILAFAHETHPEVFA